MMGRELKRVGIAALAAGALLLSLPGAASGAVTFGGETALAPTVFTGCGAADCTLAASTDPAGLTYAAPINGVIVRWRIVTANGTAMWRLHMVKALTPTLYTGVASAALETVEPGAERTFATRLPVSIGDRLAVDGPPSATAALASRNGAGGQFKNFQPPLTDGGPGQASAAGGSGFALLFNADIEPDADRDGFGDETQDQCAASATTQGLCPPAGGPCAALTGKARKRCLCKQKKGKKRKRCLRRLKKAARKT